MFPHKLYGWICVLGLSLLGCHDDFYPQANDDIANTQMQTPVLIDVLANDTHYDEFWLNWIGEPEYGRIAATSRGTISYTPDPAFIGVDGFQYEIIDDDGRADVAWVTVIVEGLATINNDPIARNDESGTPLDTPVNIAVLANDCDADGDTLTLASIGDPSNGSAAAQQDGSILYTPDAGFTGDDRFHYTVSDGYGGTAAATVTVTVSPAGSTASPLAADDHAYTSLDDPVFIDVLANDWAAQGDALAVVAVTDPENGNAEVQSDGAILYIPSPGFTGNVSFAYTVRDSRGNGATATVHIIIAAAPNQSPVAGDDAAYTAADVTLDIDVLANDSDPDGDALTVSHAAQPSNGTTILTAEGVIRYTPHAGFAGIDTFFYSVADGRGGSAVATVEVTVNTLPVATDDSAWTLVGTPVVINVLSNDVDSDGHVLLVAIVADAAHGSVKVNDDSTVAYTPQSGFAGEDSFTYSVEDELGGKATATVRVVVDTPPVASDDNALTNANAPVTVRVLDNDTDADGDPLHVERVTQPANGRVDIRADAIRYTPAVDFAGVDAFTYTVADGRGGAATASVTVTVNTPPVAADVAVTASFEMTLQVDVLTAADDADGDALRVTAVTAATSGAAALEADGSIRYTPAPGFAGTATFQYTVEDGRGGSANGNVTVTVTPNRLPVATADTVTTTAAQAVEIDVLHNDVDPDGHPLRVVAVSHADHGDVTITAVGKVRYTPDSGFMGIDSFQYYVDDGKGGMSSATVVVTVE